MLQSLKAKFIIEGVLALKDVDEGKGLPHCSCGFSLLMGSSFMKAVGCVFYCACLGL